MNVIKLRKHKNQRSSIQTSITIPLEIANKLDSDGITQVNVKYNEERGIVECIPIMEDE